VSKLTLRKVASWAGNAVAVALTTTCMVVVSMSAIHIWRDATPAGQVSCAILAGCALIAAAVWLASRRPPANVVLRCDAMEGVELAGVGGNVYVIAPNATRVQEIHRSVAPAPSKVEG
jgi:hypothetical protein